MTEWEKHLNNRVQAYITAQPADKQASAYMDFVAGAEWALKYITSKKCGPTHYACQCILERIAKLETQNTKLAKAAKDYILWSPGDSHHRPSAASVLELINKALEGDTALDDNTSSNDNNKSVFTGNKYDSCAQNSSNTKGDE